MSFVTIVAPAGNGRFPGDSANASWAEALRVYRSSLNLYHHAMELRARREARVAAQTEVTLVASYRSVNAAPPELPSLNNLSVREREVARLLASGDTNQQIAEKLVLTRGTVANHVSHILGKLGVANRTQVAALVYQNGSS